MIPATCLPFPSLFHRRVGLLQIMLLSTAGSGGETFAACGPSGAEVPHVVVAVDRVPPGQVGRERLGREHDPPRNDGSAAERRNGKTASR